MKHACDSHWEGLSFGEWTCDTVSELLKHFNTRDDTASKKTYISHLTWYHEENVLCADQARGPAALQCHNHEHQTLSMKWRPEIERIYVWNTRAERSETKRIRLNYKFHLTNITEDYKDLLLYRDANTSCIIINLIIDYNYCSFSRHNPGWLIEMRPHLKSYSYIPAAEKRDHHHNWNRKV